MPRRYFSLGGKEAKKRKASPKLLPNCVAPPMEYGENSRAQTTAECRARLPTLVVPQEENPSQEDFS